MENIKQKIIRIFFKSIKTLLPISILVFVLNWLWDIAMNTLKPITKILHPRYITHNISAEFLVFVICIIFIFLFGLLLETKFGKNIYGFIENTLFLKIPGYKPTKETILQLVDKNKFSFRYVAIVQTFNNDTKQVGFITDIYKDQLYTVFIPTGPNPTSGNIYIFPKKQIEIIDVSIEYAIKLILGCGTNSCEILKILNAKNKKKI